MEASSYFSRVPIEVLCMIINHLPDDDKISLKFAYPHFFSQHRRINVRENFSCSEENILKILQLHHNPDVVTNLDLNFCYWISNEELSNFTKQCTNLTELAVAHSTITSHNLAEILHENPNITKLSLSIRNPEEFWSKEKHVVKCLHQLQQNYKEHSGNTSTSWENLLSLSHFGICHKTLAQLKSLNLHMGQHPIILGTLLFACKNLETFTLKLDVERDIPEQFQFSKLRTGASKVISGLLGVSSSEHNDCWNHFLPRTMSSFALQHSSRSKIHSLDIQMESFVQQIVERSSSYLQCWWAPIPFVPVRETNLFSLKNLIAWKESKSFGNSLQLHEARLPAMESLACNKYMQKSDYHVAQLKQIECGFWKDSFIQFCRSHPSLERVRLNKRPCEVSELYSIVNWAKIPAIKVLSLHSRIIYASDYLQNSWKRNRAERALCMLLTACPSLEELEICPDFHESYESLTRDLRESFITADSLCGLVECTNLKKFSVNSVTISYKCSEINDPSFLEEIVTKCPNLESLYIQDLRVNLTNSGLLERNLVIVNRLYNDCIERCCLALRSARRLSVLRLKLRVVSHSFDQMIRLLTYYPSLVQLGLIVTSIDLPGGNLNMYKWDEAEFTAFFVDLVVRLPKLVALLVVLPGASQSHCILATTTLEAKFRTTRPCFCVQITDSLDNTSPPNLPLVHFQALAHDPHPSVGDLPYHLTPFDSRF